MSARLLRHGGALTAAFMILISIAPPTYAQPVEGPDPAVTTTPDPAVNTTMSFTDLGLDNTLRFYGDTGQTTLSFPVPAGLKPDTLNATLIIPFRMRSANLSVTQDDRVISKVEFPLTDFAPVVIPLGSAEVADGSVTVTLRLSSLADDGYCLDPDNPISLIDSSITYTGSQLPPSTIADFLPPVLRTLTIGLPESPTQAESDSAVQLAAALESRYRSQAPRVVLVRLAGDATSIADPTPPLERRIIIKEGGEEGVSLSGGPDPQLLISGPPDKLTNQAQLLADNSLNMAASTRAVAGKLRSHPMLPGDSTSLAQLGDPTLSSTGVAPRVGIVLDQTRFGHSTQSFRVHVMGSHTPVPTDVGARMTASVSDELIDSWQAGSDGRIDHWVSIPDRLVHRYTELSVGVDTSGNTGRCGEFRPITLTIDGNTVVESALAQPPIPPGLGALPQALMPRVRVGINPDSFADTERATQIVVGLQRMSVVPLSTEVTSLKQAIDSKEPAILVSPDGWTNQSVTLPVSSQDQNLKLVNLDADNEETTLTLDPGIRFGSLQTVFDGQRSLLVATSNGAPAQLDELLRWLDNDPRGWSKLHGNAVVAIEGREPALVPDRASPNVSGPAAPTNLDVQAPGNRPPVWWIAAGVGAAVVIGIASYRLGTRRRPRGTNSNP